VARLFEDNAAALTSLSSNLDEAEAAVGAMSVSQYALKEHLVGVIEEAKAAIARRDWQAALDGLEKAEGQYKTLQGFTDFYDNYILAGQALNVLDPDEGSAHFGRTVNPGNLVDTVASTALGSVTGGGLGRWADQKLGKLFGRDTEPFDDLNQNMRYDEGEPFEDLDGDGMWSAGGAVLNPVYGAIDKVSNVIADNPVSEGIQDFGQSVHAATVAPVINWQPVEDQTVMDYTGRETTISGKPLANIVEAAQGVQGFVSSMLPWGEDSVWKKENRSVVPMEMRQGGDPEVGAIVAESDALDAKGETIHTPMNRQETLDKQAFSERLQTHDPVTGKQYMYNVVPIKSTNTQVGREEGAGDAYKDEEGIWDAQTGKLLAAPGTDEYNYNEVPKPITKSTPFRKTQVGGPGQSSFSAPARPIPKLETGPRRTIATDSKSRRELFKRLGYNR